MILDTLARFLARPAVADWLIARAMKRPYSPIVKNGQTYMERYWLFNPYPDTGQSGADRPRWKFPVSIRIHRIVLPDQDRDCHDHPWHARTFILRGWYCEERVLGWGGRLGSQGEYIHRGNYVESRARFPGMTARLGFGEYHRITRVSTEGVWTLFVTGPHRGVWGFLVDGVKVEWRKYLGIDK